jgi:vacuolar-type H+-ATPase subunit I/STV1
MSDEDDKSSPYEEVTCKLDTIDMSLHKAQEEIAELVRKMKEDPEFCPDEVDSEKALQEALNNFFINELIKQKPVGDA